MISNQEMISYGKFLLEKFSVKSDNVTWEEIISDYKKQRTKFKPKVANRPGLMYINWVVAREFGMDSTLVELDRSNRHVMTKARRYVYYVALKLYGYKLQEIADFYEKKSHATVLQGIRTAENEVRLYKEDKAHLVSILNYLKEENGEEIEGNSTEGES